MGVRVVGLKVVGATVVGATDDGDIVVGTVEGVAVGSSVVGA